MMMQILFKFYFKNSFGDVLYVHNRDNCYLMKIGRNLHKKNLSMTILPLFKYYEIRGMIWIQIFDKWSQTLKLYNKLVSLC